MLTRALFNRLYLHQACAGTNALIMPKRGVKRKTVEVEHSPDRRSETPPVVRQTKRKSAKVVTTTTTTVTVSATAVVETAPLGTEVSQVTQPLASAVSPQRLASKKFIGGHFSISGGPKTAVREAVEHGANAFALFVRSSRTWNCPPLSPTAVAEFKEAMKESGLQYSKIVAHGSYLINPGSPDPAVLAKSRAGMLDEMQRCEQLGIKYYNLHPGSTCNKISVDECIDLIAQSVSQTLAATKDVTLLLENMCCQGNTLGGELEELAQIISKVDDGVKDRVGICLDTCHAFAAGNDISTKEGWDLLMKKVETILGLHQLKALHLNDSMFAAGAHRDRHEKIGKGLIGVEAFKHLINDPRTNNLPMILETEPPQKPEIDLLFSLHESAKAF
ncbi:hypothetical protein RvY_10450 [Ramazzottius varieornatus]|uniref:Xylose isomerase-like TIM barrel domain-containing protein n=1 Tax=Ramazzottius varieornatus TaxID=947166 RepID=A0A1D1VCS6_RAMVA|nr:hypothetical protein RvY_10450 [Ramazzottius varieornatus]